MAKGFLGFLVDLATLAPGFVVGVSFHECAHAYVAYLLGDNTAKRLGRLTVNPRAHLSLMGTLFLLIFHIGWANPVPFDERNFKYPRFYSLLVAFAGPSANLIIAYLFLTLLKYLPMVLYSIPLYNAIYMVCEALVQINIMLAVFNMLPLPPLDGSHVIRVLLPKTWLPYYYLISSFSIFILLVLLMLPVTNQLFSKAIIMTQKTLTSLVL